MAGEGVFDLSADEVNDGFDKILKATRRARSEIFAQPPGDNHHERTQHNAEKHRIQMPGPETDTFMSDRVAVTRTQVGEVMLYIFDSPPAG